MDKQKLERVEEYIFTIFQNRRAVKILAKEIFESGREYANADLVRAFEDLEKRHRLLVRYTDEGDDWVHLTPEGAKLAGLTEFESAEKPEAPPHPPKSAT
jgi:hypothetical protein